MFPQEGEAFYLNPPHPLAEFYPSSPREKELSLRIQCNAFISVYRNLFKHDSR